VPPAPVPPEIAEFLRAPNPAVIATVRPDGSPHTAATWYDWEDGRVLVNMDASRLRLRFLRDDPRVAISVLDRENWYRHVSLIGEVERMGPDEGWRDIDRLARRYTGRPYRNRAPRISAWVRVDQWHSWDTSRPMEAEAA
jgi:PPOX class probable F420-dependent enzyme